MSPDRDQRAGDFDDSEVGFGQEERGRFDDVFADPSWDEVDSDQDEPAWDESETLPTNNRYQPFDPHDDAEIPLAGRREDRRPAPRDPGSSNVVLGRKEAKLRRPEEDQDQGGRAPGFGDDEELAPGPVDYAGKDPFSDESAFPEQPPPITDPNTLVRQRRPIAGGKTTRFDRADGAPAWLRTPGVDKAAREAQSAVPPPVRKPQPAARPAVEMDLEDSAPRGGRFSRTTATMQHSAPLPTRPVGLGQPQTLRRPGQPAKLAPHQRKRASSSSASRLVMLAVGLCLCAGAGWYVYGQLGPEAQATLAGRVSELASGASDPSRPTASSPLSPRPTQPDRPQAATGERLNGYLPTIGNTSSDPAPLPNPLASSISAPPVPQFKPINPDGTLAAGGAPRSVNPRLAASQQDDDPPAGLFERIWSYISPG